MTRSVRLDLWRMQQRFGQEIDAIGDYRGRMDDGREVSDRECATGQRRTQRQMTDGALATVVSGGLIVTRRRGTIVPAMRRATRRVFVRYLVMLRRWRILVGVRTMQCVLRASGGMLGL